MNSTYVDREESFGLSYGMDDPHITIKSPTYGDYIVTYLGTVDIPTTIKTHGVDIAMEWSEKHHPKEYDFTTVKVGDEDGLFKVYAPIAEFNRPLPIASTKAQAEFWMERSAHVTAHMPRELVSPLVSHPELKDSRLALQLKEGLDSFDTEKVDTALTQAEIHGVTVKDMEKPLKSLLRLNPSPEQILSRLPTTIHRTIAGISNERSHAIAAALRPEKEVVDRSLGLDDLKVALGQEGAKLIPAGSKFVVSYPGESYKCPPIHTRPFSKEDKERIEVSPDVKMLPQGPEDVKFLQALDRDDISIRLTPTEPTGYEMSLRHASGPVTMPGYDQVFVGTDGSHTPSRMIETLRRFIGEQPLSVNGHEVGQAAEGIDR